MSERREERTIGQETRKTLTVGSGIMLSQTLGVKTAVKKITAVATSELQIK